MTIQIAAVYLILLVSLALFITERIRFDVVALSVLGTLAVTGLVTPDEAFSGFSNPAVITVWAMFIISQGLATTGIAGQIGRRVVKLAGHGEASLVAAITLTAAFLSAFMNNIGVAALLLPVTMDISRTTGISPSRLLMPMAFGSLLGGLTTLVGTPPNLLVSMSLEGSGYAAFGLFDFAWVGVPIVVVCVVFFLLVGRKLLPSDSHTAETRLRPTEDLRERYQLQERTFIVRVKPGSRLDGKTVASSRLATVAGLRVVAALQNGRARLLPSPNAVLRGGQQLLVQGRQDRLLRLGDWGELIVSREAPVVRDLISSEVLLFEVRVAESSGLIGTAIVPNQFRDQYLGNVLAVRRGDEIRRTEFSEFELEADDLVLVQGGREALDRLEHSGDFDECFQVPDDVLVNVYDLPRHIFLIRVPSDSDFVGQTLAESGIIDLFGFHLLAVIAGGSLDLKPGRDREIRAEDRLLVQGTYDQIDVLRAFQELEIDTEKVPDLGDLESERMEMIEVMLAPRSGRAGDAIADMQFREKYGIEVLAVWREGKAHRSNLGSMRLKLGDAFLLYGPRDKLMLIEQDSDFLVLTPLVVKPLRRDKARLSVLILIAVVLSVLTGLLPIAVAAVCGAAAMVLTGCLTMEDAYRAIEWRAIFLIAGMLPLGIALQTSGGATFMAMTVMDLMSGAGPWSVIFAFYAVTALATLFIPTAALVVLMGPIAMTASAEMGVDPRTAMMAIAIAASASFASPVSHPANLLVMGPGGYRFVDYFKLGIPITLLVGLVTAVLLPFVWPLQPAG